MTPRSSATMNPTQRITRAVRKQARGAARAPAAAKSAEDIQRPVALNGHDAASSSDPAVVAFPEQAPKGDAKAIRERLGALTVDLIKLAESAQPPPAFVIPGWLPEGCVTLLAAHGSAGKSLLGLYIAISIAAGLAVLEQPARPPRRALFYSAEDPAPVVRWRVQQYCAALGLTVDSLDGWLFVLDAAELEAPELFAAQRSTRGLPTPAHAALRQLMAEHQIDVAVIDNASDVFAASEIERPAVRAFIRALQRLLPASHIGAIVLLAHVNRAASVSNTAGTLYSGSTAWNNSVRSRLELTLDKGDDEDRSGDPPKTFTLRRAKANYAAADGVGLQFHWNYEFGVILPDEQPGPMIQAIARRNDERIVLAAFAEAEQTGQCISANVKANNCASKTFADMGVALPRHLRDMRSLSPVLRALQRRGLLCIESFTDDQRKRRERWALTLEGFAEVRQ